MQIISSKIFEKILDLGKGDPDPAGTLNFHQSPFITFWDDLHTDTQTHGPLRKHNCIGGCNYSPELDCDMMSRCVVRRTAVNRWPAALYVQHQLVILVTVRVALQELVLDSEPNVREDPRHQPANSRITLLTSASLSVVHELCSLLSRFASTCVNLCLATEIITGCLQRAS